MPLSEREKILFFRTTSYSVVQIAAELGWHSSSIARELRGNTIHETYSPITAQELRIAVTTQAAYKRMFRELNGQPLHSITPDRGKEFANYSAVTEALGGVQFYFPPLH